MYNYVVDDDDVFIELPAYLIGYAMRLYDYVGICLYYLYQYNA